MKLLLAFLLAPVFCSAQQLIDNDWKFFRGGSFGAESPEFDDSGWRSIDLPHDWSIEDLPGSKSPFSPDAISAVGGGFTTGGTGWYRKVLIVPAENSGKNISLIFEGVYMNSEIWLNGQSLGIHPYGYTSFSYDISKLVKPGQKNILAVKVRSEGENSRWYSGAGIYRHVWITVKEKVYATLWGTVITTPEINTMGAQVAVNVNVMNTDTQPLPVKVTVTLLNPKKEATGKAQTTQTILANAADNFKLNITVPAPLLWSVDSPGLYTAMIEVSLDDVVLDRYPVKFGIRQTSFDATNGFLLNGKSLKLKGGCVHNDNGPLGSKTYDRAEERKIELLKASGFNAIRCSHNPPSPAFLDACDRIGMLVIDEAFDTWNLPKNAYDYSLYFDKWWKRDLQNMVIRDRNHPSVIVWSIGNEIPDMEEPETEKTARMLSAFVHELDPTRPVTAAVNGLNERKDPFFSALDIAGYNYADDHNTKARVYENDHQRLPNRVMFGSESYALTAFQNWMDVSDHSYVVGDFVWTAFDYIGEASIGWLGYYQHQNFYPWNLAYCGDIDICGWKRPQSYYRDALWMKNKISVFVKPPTDSFKPNPKKEAWSIWNWHDVVADWNWKGYEGKLLEVTVYSSCDEAELFLDGKSLGKKPTNRSTQFLATWMVPYKAGILKAVGITAKKQVGLAELHTAGAPAQIKLTADRIDLHGDQDLSYITVEVLDANGIRDPKAENEINFTIKGGTIAGVGNAQPMSLESYQEPKRKAWQGRCLVVAKADTPGTITLSATASGLKPATISVNVQ